MEGGFIVDHTYGATKPSDWVEGEPVKSFWHGTKISGKKQYQIVTYRCVRCGYLESYAYDEKDRSSLSDLFT
jgi:hypothetical protein